VLEGLVTRSAEDDEMSEGLAVDPHVWLDPKRMDEIVAKVGEAILKTSPPDDCGIAERTDGLRSRIERLDDEYTKGLADCERDVLVTAHDAFGYLADAYGLHIESIAGLEPDIEPSARRLAEIRDLVEREGVTTIFTEELVAPDVAETLASEAGVATAVLYTIEGLTADEESAGADYVSLMEENLDALRVALACH
jgi:zinc transport system substrate-binding protein